MAATAKQHDNFSSSLPISFGNLVGNFEGQYLIFRVLIRSEIQSETKWTEQTQPIN